MKSEHTQNEYHIGLAVRLLQSVPHEQSTQRSQRASHLCCRDCGHIVHSRRPPLSRRTRSSCVSESVALSVLTSVPPSPAPRSISPIDLCVFIKVSLIQMSQNSTDSFRNIFC